MYANVDYPDESVESVEVAALPRVGDSWWGSDRKEYIISEISWEVRHGKADPWVILVVKDE